MPLPYRLRALSLFLALGVSALLPAAGEEFELEVAKELLETGEYEEAESFLAEGPDEEAVWLLRARLLRETGRGAEAIEALAATSLYQEGAPPIRARVGTLRVEKGDIEVARKDFREALKKDPDNVEARAGLGLLLLWEGKRVESRAHLKKVLQYYQRLSYDEAAELSPETYVWMGRACEGLNRHADAYRVMYDSALDLDAESPVAHDASGLVLLAKYNYPDARSHFKDALKRNPRRAESHIGLARSTYIDMRYPGNRFQDTVKHLAAADRVWKDHPDALVLRGHLAFYDESWSEAEDYYRRAVAANPRRLDRLAHLAALLYSVPRLDEFTQLEKEVARLHPAPAEFYGVLAEKLVERFFYRQAADFARRAIQLDEDYWPAYVTLGINALRVGRDEEGEEWIQKAFDADRFNVWAKNSKILIRHIEENFVEESTEDFVFRLRKDDRPFLLPYLRPLMEEAKLRMEKQYQVSISKPIVVEDFSEHSYFSARSIGLPGLAASGVCFGSMVTLTTPKAIPGNWGAVAVHEFAHVISLQKTGSRVPRWFTEGLSVFEEGRAIRRWTRFYADEFVDAVHNDRLLPMAQIQSGFTKPQWPGQILLSYYQGGVICAFIESRFGFDKIVAMLAAYGEGKNTEQVFQEVLGLTLEEFDARFRVHARELADSFGIWCRYTPDQIQGFRFEAEDDPDDVEKWVRLGLAYHFAGQPTDAELTIGKALKLDGDHGDLNALIGFVKLGQGKKKGAREAFEKALANETHYRYRSHVALGLLLRPQEPERALEHFQQAITLHPDGVRPRFGEPNPYYQVVGILNELDREEEAIEVLERLLQVSRDDVEVRKKLGAIYRLREEWEKLTNALWDAVYIDPYDLEIRRLLARGYMEIESWERALRDLEVQLNGESPAFGEIYGDMAWCHYKLGHEEEALDYAKRALEASPGNERALEVKGALE